MKNGVLLLLTQKSPQLPSYRTKDEDRVRQKKLTDTQGREKKFGKHEDRLIASFPVLQQFSWCICAGLSTKLLMSGKACVNIKV